MRTLIRWAALAAATVGVSITSMAHAQSCTAQWLPGEQAGSLYGHVFAFTTFDLDGAGPNPPVLIAAGTSLKVPGLPDYCTILSFDGTRWSELEHGSIGAVYALAIHNGELYAAGQFTSLGGTTVANIARWTGSGWAPLGTGIGGANDTVTSLASYNGYLYAGGKFTNAGGTTVSNLARWDGTWSGVSTGITSTATTPVQALMTFSNVLWIGGNFTAAGGGAAVNLATWDGASFHAVGNPNGEVRGLSSYANTAVTSARVVAVGPFTSIGGVAVSNIARYSTNAGTWAALGSVSGGTGYRVASRPVGVSSNEIDAVFSIVNTSGIYYVAYRWNASAGTWTPLGGDSVNTLAFSGGPLVAGSDGQPAASIYDGTTFKPIGAASGAPGPIAAMTVGGPASGPANGQLVAAFESPSYFTPTTSNVARRDPVTGAWTPMSVAITGTNGINTIYGRIRCLETLADGTVMMGGQFTSLDYQNFGGLAAYGGSGWTSVGYATVGFSPIASVNAIQDGVGPEYFVGGHFDAINGYAANNIARASVGGVFSPLGTGVNGDVLAIKRLSNGDLIVGGTFTTAGDAPASRIARWNGSAWSPMGSGFISTVTDIAILSDGTIVAAGAFNGSGSTPLNHIARWTGTTWAPMGAGLGTQPQFVYKLLPLPGGRLLAGGGFDAGGGVSHNVALWDGQQWLPVEQGVSGDYTTVPVNSLRLLPDGTAAVGGRFEFVYPSSPSAFFARYTFGAPADLGMQGGLSGADGVLDNNDFIAFINDFFGADPRADFGIQGGLSGQDGQFDNNDFIAFINAFFNGCP